MSPSWMSEAGIDLNAPFGTTIPGYDLDIDLKTGDLSKYKSAFDGYQAGQAGDNLSNLTKLAGNLSELFKGGGQGQSLKELEKKMEKAREILLEEEDRYEGKIDDRLEAIYPGLTGLTGEEALNRYRQEFSQNVQDYTAQGRADLDRNPDVSSQFQQSMRDIADVQNQFSLANELGGYPQIALDPQVPKSDTDRLKRLMTNVGDAIEAEGSMDYMKRPETAYLMSGIQADRAAAIGDYLSSSADVGRLMNYGNIG